MQIESVEEPLIAIRISQYPEDNKCEFLLLGRSNVGKSSFINTLIKILCPTLLLPSNNNSHLLYSVF